MTRYVINGKFLTQRLTGVQRVAQELTRSLDGLVGPGEVQVATPGRGILYELPLRNIEVVSCGRRTGSLWEQTDFTDYAMKTGAVPLNLCNAAPLRYPGVVCVHDAYMRTMPGNFSRRFVAWYRLLFREYERRALGFLTVSRFSRHELARYYPRMARDMAVIPCAWQHMRRIEADEAVFEREGSVKRGEYYLSIASASRSKNFDWVVRTAERNPGSQFVIAGGHTQGILREIELSWPPNVVRLGYVSDGVLKALMSNCKAFVFPSLYEGFGLPPLEAMACGARVVLSDIAVFHEVYGESATYVDPCEPAADLDTLCEEEPAVPSAELLGRYSWDRSAAMLLDALRAFGSPGD